MHWPQKQSKRYNLARETDTPNICQVGTNLYKGVVELGIDAVYVCVCLGFFCFLFLEITAILLNCVFFHMVSYLNIYILWRLLPLALHLPIILLVTLVSSTQYNQSGQPPHLKYTLLIKSNCFAWALRRLFSCLFHASDPSCQHELKLFEVMVSFETPVDIRQIYRTDLYMMGTLIMHWKTSLQLEGITLMYTRSFISGWCGPITALLYEEHWRWYYLKF